MLLDKLVTAWEDGKREIVDHEFLAWAEEDVGEDDIPVVMELLASDLLDSREDEDEGEVWYWLKDYDRTVAALGYDFSTGSHQRGRPSGLAS